LHHLRPSVILGFVRSYRSSRCAWPRRSGLCKLACTDETVVRGHDARCKLIISAVDANPVSKRSFLQLSYAHYNVLETGQYKSLSVLDIALGCCSTLRLVTFPPLLRHRRYKEQLRFLRNTRVPPLRYVVISTSTINVPSTFLQAVRLRQVELRPRTVRPGACDHANGCISELMVKLVSLFNHIHITMRMGLVDGVVVRN
jgi:hypothetical protein